MQARKHQIKRLKVKADSDFSGCENKSSKATRLCKRSSDTCLVPSEANHNVLHWSNKTFVTHERKKGGKYIPSSLCGWFLEICTQELEARPSLRLASAQGLDEMKNAIGCNCTL